MKNKKAGLGVKTTPAFFLALFLLLVLIPSPSEAVFLRVAVVRAAAELEIASPMAMVVTDEATGDSKSFERAFRVLRDGRRIYIEGFGRRTGPILVRPTGDRIVINGRPYRGAARIQFGADGRLTAVNLVELEDYLYGVMSAEIPTAWSPAAVEAQAITSRTFALANLGKWEQEGFDLTNTTSDQVYLGINAEDAGAYNAVNNTRGLVLTYEGGLVSTPFCAASGGRTESLEEVWGGAPTAYTRVVADPFDQACPYYSWEAELSRRELSEIASRLDIPLSNIVSIAPTRISPSGRVNQLAFVSSRGARSRSVSANRFRILAGAQKVRSTMFVITPTGGGIRLFGRGWGHGVGFSQWGARTMGEMGYSREAILQHYYPGTVVEVHPLYLEREREAESSVAYPSGFEGSLDEFFSRQEAGGASESSTTTPVSPAEPRYE